MPELDKNNLYLCNLKIAELYEIHKVLQNTK